MVHETYEQKEKDNFDFLYILCTVTLGQMLC